MFDEYIRLYSKRLFGLCAALCASKYDAEDLYQETWLRAMKKFSSYDSARSFETWITRICLNAYRDFLRRKKISPISDAFSDSDEKERLILNFPDEEKDDVSGVRDAVDALPEKLRETVILFYFADLGEKRTAQMLKIPVGTVKSRLNKARKMLKEKMLDE